MSTNTGYEFVPVPNQPEPHVTQRAASLVINEVLAEFGVPFEDVRSVSYRYRTLYTGETETKVQVLLAAENSTPKIVHANFDFQGDLGAYEVDLINMNSAWMLEICTRSLARVETPEGCLPHIPYTTTLFNQDVDADQK